MQLKIISLGNFTLNFFFKDISHYFQRNSRMMLVSLVIRVWAEYKFSQKQSGSFIISADVSFVTWLRTWINAVVILRYHIEGNFQERKLSRIDEKYNFREENFCRLLAFAVPKDAMPPNFGEKTFANSHKTVKFVEVFSFESFLPYGITVSWYHVWIHTVLSLSLSPCSLWSDHKYIHDRHWTMNILNCNEYCSSWRHTKPTSVSFKPEYINDVR